MADLVEARVEHRFKASAEAVFDAWLNPETVRQWMAKALRSMQLSGEVLQVEIDARVGGKFVFSDRREQGEAMHWGYYREIDRPHRLAFTWFTSEEDEAANTSLVVLTLTPDGSGCVATITHSIDAQWRDYIPQTERGWGAMLQQIAD